MKNNKVFAGVLGLVLSAASLFSQAAIIAATDFDGRSVSGATASNLNWTVNGIAALGDITVSQGATRVGGSLPALALFATSAGADKLAVDRNINNESDWYFDVSLNVLSGNMIFLKDFSVDAFIFSNAGVFQSVERLLTVGLTIFNNSNVLFNQSETVFSDVIPNTNTSPNRTVSFDLNGVDLSEGGAYTLRLSALGQTGANGNNAGFDNFALSGKIAQVNAPGTLLMFGLLALVLGGRRFIRR